MSSFGRRCCRVGAVNGFSCAAVPDGDFVTSFHQVRGHVVAHDSQSQECDAHYSSPFRKISGLEIVGPATSTCLESQARHFASNEKPMLNITIRRKAKQFSKLVRHSAVTPRTGRAYKPEMAKASEMGVTFIGHSSFFIQIGGQNLVI